MSEHPPVPPPPPPPPPSQATPTISFDPAPAPPPPPDGGAPVQPTGDAAAGGGRGRRGGRTAVIGGIAAVLVLGGGIGAYAMYDRLSGGGTQPHDVLPASTQIYARFDLDPSASQKVDLFRLLRKVPDLADEVGIKDDGQDIRRLVFPEIIASACDDVDYEKDVEPWLGDRIGIGANVQDKSVVVAVQTTDEKASRAGIEQLFACADEEYGLAYLDGYALIAPKQADVDRAVKATEKASLADSTTFGEDFDELGEQGIASGWIDLEALTAIPEAKEALGSELDRVVDIGSVATTLRADGDAIELAVLSGVDEKAAKSGDAKGTPLAKLPADTVAALSVSGAGDSIAEAFDSFVQEFDDQFSGGGAGGSGGTGIGDDAAVPSSDTLAEPVLSTVPTPDVPSFPTPTAPPTAPTDPSVPDDPSDPFGQDDPSDPFGQDDPFGPGGPAGFDVRQFLDDLEAETGFQLPEDLQTLLGDNLTLAIGSKNLEKLPALSGPDDLSTLDVALALTSDRDSATDLTERIARLASDNGIPLVSSSTDDGAVLATNQGAADAIAESDGSLGDSDAFKSVIPDGDDVVGGFYVDLGTILDKLLEADPPEDVRKGIESAKALSAVGASTTTDGDRSLSRLRVSFE